MALPLGREDCAMRMGCAECGCVVEAGARVVVCDAPGCCCAELPVADADLVTELDANDDDGPG